MLTLTRDKLPQVLPLQVLPLAEILRNKTGAFFFNRLSRVGEGAKLSLPAPEDYHRFLETHLQASKENPVLGLPLLPDPSGLRRMSGRIFRSGPELFRKTGPLLFYFPNRDNRNII
jgi:hypothetical protein